MHVQINYIHVQCTHVGGNEGECVGEDMETTSDGTYSQPQQTERDESGSLEKGGNDITTLPALLPSPVCVCVCVCVCVFAAYMGAGYQDSTHFQIHIHVHEYISLRCIYIYMYIHVCYIIYMHTCMCRFQHGKCARCTKTACSVSSFWKGDHKHTHIHTYMYALTHNVHVHSLMLLQVMHEFPVVSLDGATATTSRQDYVSHDITSMARQRMDALNTNRVSLSYTYMYMYVCVCMCVCVYTKKKKRMYLLTAPYHSHGIHSWLLSSVVDMTRVVNITRPLVTVHSVVSLSSHCTMYLPQS